LAIIGQALNGVATTRAEDAARTGQRIAGQRLTAQRGQTNDAAADSTGSTASKIRICGVI